jgi:competence protein ComEA
MQKKERTLLLVFLVAILLAGSVYLYGGKKGQDAQVPLSTANMTSTSEQQRTQTNGAMLRVHVKGEVNQPGVIQIPADSRVIDAIQAAGGSKAGADLEKLNLAAVVADGSEVIVPKAGADTEQSAAPTGSTNATGKININTATVDDLDKLPGIGSTRAGAIIAYRQEHGRFLQIEDLKKVPGIGVKMFDQIRDKVTVN